MHKKGKIVAVWVDLITPKELYMEDEAFYRIVYERGIDMLTTDNCKIAEDCLQKIHLETLLKSNTKNEYKHKKQTNKYTTNNVKITDHLNFYG